MLVWSELNLALSWRRFSIESFETKSSWHQCLFPLSEIILQLLSPSSSLTSLLALSSLDRLRFCFPFKHLDLCWCLFEPGDSMRKSFLKREFSPKQPPNLMETKTCLKAYSSVLYLCRLPGEQAPHSFTLSKSWNSSKCMCNTPQRHHYQGLHHRQQWQWQGLGGQQLPFLCPL